MKTLKVVFEEVVNKHKTRPNVIIFKRNVSLTLTDRDQTKCRGGHELIKVKPCGLAALEELHNYKAGWGRMGKREGKGGREGIK